MKFRKIGASLLAAAMLAGSCLTASAAEVPPETCTVEYKQMSPEIEVTAELKKVDNKKIAYVNIVIPEGAPADLVISFDSVIDAVQGISYVPGMIQNISVSITNNSGHQYSYKDNSFVLAPMDTSGLGSLEDGSLLPALGYDGQYLWINNVGSMLPKYFYEEIFHVKNSAAVTFEMMCQIYEYLEKAGYDSIADYLVSYYGYSSWNELVADEKGLAEAMFSSGSTNNGIYPMSEAELNDMIKKYPWIDKYLYVQSSGNELKVQIKWPEEKIAALSYDYFYNDLYYFAYGKENVDKLITTSNTNAYTKEHALGFYQAGEAANTEANAFFANLINSDAFNNGSTVNFDMAFALDGPGINNQYGNYSFGFYNVIELQQTDGDVTVSKVDPDGNTVNGAEFVVGRVVNGETQYLGYEGEWTADQQAAATFISENGSFTVEKLPFGDYFLQEIAAPDGYVLLDETVPFTVDEITETIEVVNQLEEEEIPDESTPLTPPGEDGSTPSDDTEEIPDESNPLAPATGEASSSPVWFAVGMILAGCCVCALAVCRRKEARKQK